MDLAPHRFPRRHLPPRKPSHSLAHVFHGYELGFYGQGSGEHILFRGNTQAPQEIQINFSVVLQLCLYHALPCHRPRQLMANQFLHTDLAVGNRRRQSFPPAHRAKPQLDALHLVNGEWARVSESLFVVPRGGGPYRSFGSVLVEITING